MPNHESLPQDVLEHVFEYLYGDRAAMASIARTSRAFKQIVDAIPRLGYGLFKEHYKYTQHNLPIQLKLEKLNSFHIRLGNRLVYEAIPYMQAGKKEEAVNIILIAMQGHRSSNAMAIFEIMGQIGYHKFKANSAFSLQKYIKSYRKAEDKVLVKEVEDNFEQEDWGDIKRDLRLAQTLFDSNIDLIKSAFENLQLSYQEEFQKKLTDALYTDDAVHYRNEIKAGGFLDRGPDYEQKYPKAFNAKGYIGLEAPNNDNVWYLQLSKNTEEKFKMIEPYTHPRLK